jgi:Zn-dependent M32 family carboxypeptidase
MNHKLIIAQIMGGTQDIYPIGIPKHVEIWGNWEDKLSELEYDNSWEWQIPAWSKICQESKELASKLKSEDTKPYFIALEKYEEAIFTNDVKKGYETLIGLLEWLTTNNH